MDAADENDADDIRYTQDFQRRLAAFNMAEWCVTCRKMQVLLARGEDEYARRVLDDFIGREVPKKISLSTHVSHAFTVRYANALEAAGFKTLGALKGVSDRDLLEVCDVGEKILKAVRTVLRAVERGDIVELEQDEVGDLIDRRLIGERL